MFDCFLDFKSEVISFHVWLKSRIILFHIGGPAKERENRAAPFYHVRQFFGTK
jgi:hypothetical protein